MIRALIERDVTGTEIRDLLRKAKEHKEFVKGRAFLLLPRYFGDLSQTKHNKFKIGKKGRNNVICDGPPTSETYIYIYIFAFGFYAHHLITPQPLPSVYPP